MLTSYLKRIIIVTFCSLTSFSSHSIFGQKSGAFFCGAQSLNDSLISMDEWQSEKSQHFEKLYREKIHLKKSDELKMMMLC